MALTFALPANAPSPTPVVRSAALGGIKPRFQRVTTDAAYATGGYAVTPANFKLDTAVVYVDAGPGVSGFTPVYNSATAKLMFFKQTNVAGPLIECATNEATLSGALFDIMVWGY